MIFWAVYLWFVSCSTFVFLTNHWMHCQTSSNNQFFFPPPNFSRQISIFGSGRTWVPWLNHWIFLELLGGKIQPSFFFYRSRYGYVSFRETSSGWRWFDFNMFDLFRFSDDVKVKTFGSVLGVSEEKKSRQKIISVGMDSSWRSLFCGHMWL